VVTVVLAVLLCAALVLLAIVARRVRRLERRLDGITRDADGRSLEGILEAHLDRVLAVDREVDQLAVRTTMLEAAGRRAFQRAGLVRFNPFEETGGNQSFALALLDAEGDGFIINSLHARSGTRVYARTLTGGRAEGQLSAEEVEALKLAQAAPPGWPAVADRPDRRSSRGA
jgi:Protein of unknown function (DUF4446)